MRLDTSQLAARRFIKKRYEKSLERKLIKYEGSEKKQRNALEQEIFSYWGKIQGTSILLVYAQLLVLRLTQEVEECVFDAEIGKLQKLGKENRAIADKLQSIKDFHFNKRSREVIVRILDVFCRLSGKDTMKSKIEAEKKVQ